MLRLYHPPPGLSPGRNTPVENTRELASTRLEIGTLTRVQIKRATLRSMPTRKPLKLHHGQVPRTAGVQQRGSAAARRLTIS
jgi:hypothetical protein